MPLTRQKRLSTWYRLRRNRRAALALLAALMGFVATFLHHESGMGWPMSLYEAIRLFQVDSAFVPALTGWELTLMWVLRFAAPAVTLGAVVEVIDHVGLLHLPSLALRLWGSDHFVVVGLGRLGTYVCERLHAEGHRVAAIERDAEHPDIGHLRAIGIPVIVGDATRPETLRYARVHTAVGLLALTDDDVTNVTVATRAEQVRGDRDDDPFESIVQVHDVLLARALPDLCSGLGPRVRILDRYAVAARHLVSTLQEPADLAIIAGFGRFGQGVAVSLARCGRPPGELWVVDPTHAHAPPEALHLLLPTPTHWKPQSMLGNGLLDELSTRVAGGQRVQFFICTDDDHRNLRYALAVRLRCPGARIVMRAFHLDEFSALKGLEVVDFINLLAPDDVPLFEHLGRQSSAISQRVAVTSNPLSKVRKQE